MVLFELGRKLESAMKKLQATPLVDDEMVTQLLNEIARALLEVCAKLASWTHRPRSKERRAAPSTTLYSPYLPYAHCSLFL